MKIARRTLVGIAFITAALVTQMVTPIAQVTTPRLAVLTLENPTTGSTIGNGLTEILVSALQKTGRFQLVDRTAAQQSPETGIDFIVKGKVTNFSFD